MPVFPFKAATISHLTDARYFAAEGAQWLGFSTPLPNEQGAALYYTRLRQMLAWIEGPLPVLELSRPLTPSETEQLLIATGVTQLQWPATNPIQEPDLPPSASWWPFFSLKHFQPDTLRSSLEAHSAFAKYLVVHYQGEPTENQLSSLADTLQGLPVILELNWTPKLLKQVHNHWDIAGIQFRGSEEEKPGVKSFDELDKLLEIITSSNTSK